MIAPERTVGKSLPRGNLGLINHPRCGAFRLQQGRPTAACDTFAAWNHGFVKRIIIRP
jgi:hypothetical protein